MRTELPEALLGTTGGERANAILRSCVHCGFCNATCPTYQITGDELDGPRGRIYLIKDLLETSEVSPVATRHLDRCLTCRACETTCPSGVQYGELLEIARDTIGVHGDRSLIERGMRGWFRHVLPDSKRLMRWAAVGRWFRWLLPEHFRAALPPARSKTLSESAADLSDGPADSDFGTAPAARDIETVAVLGGCVQSASTPETTARLLALLRRNGRRGVIVPGEVCCGSLDLHLGAVDKAREYARRNLDALEKLNVSAVLSSASGCGVTIKEYPRLLADDAHYGPLAETLSAKVFDAAEYCVDLEVAARSDYRRVAWHAPCSLQHGQRLTGVVEKLLTRAGYELVPVKDAHLCCGSAGTYSYLQKELADELRTRKLESLTHAEPEVIVTANVGCQMHLGAGGRRKGKGKGSVPVLHWLELV